MSPSLHTHSQQAYQQDDLLATALVSQAIQPGKLLHQLFNEFVDQLTVFFRLKTNLEAAKVKVATMQARNHAIEGFMNTHHTEAGYGSRLNMIR